MRRKKHGDHSCYTKQEKAVDCEQSYSESSLTELRPHALCAGVNVVSRRTQRQKGRVDIRRTKRIQHSTLFFFAPTEVSETLEAVIGIAVAIGSAAVIREANDSQCDLWFSSALLMVYADAKSELHHLLCG